MAGRAQFETPVGCSGTFCFVPWAPTAVVPSKSQSQPPQGRVSNTFLSSFLNGIQIREVSRERRIDGYVHNKGRGSKFRKVWSLKCMHGADSRERAARRAPRRSLEGRYASRWGGAALGWKLVKAGGTSKILITASNRDRNTSPNQDMA